MDNIINDEEKKPLILRYASLATKKLQKNISEEELAEMQKIKIEVGIPHEEIIKRATVLVINN